MMSPSTPSSKRPKHDEGAFFNPLVSWIRNRGGFIHQSISFHNDKRELNIRDDCEEGSLLMRLSNKVIVSRDHGIPSKLVELVIDTVDVAPDDKDGVAFQQDLSLALLLASRPNEILPYLDSLPSTVDVPSGWPEDVRKEILQGSSVLEEIDRNQLRFDKAYSALKLVPSEQWQSQCNMKLPAESDLESSFVWVKSRAFSIPSKRSSDQTIPAMMPLLDLCNHARGRQASKNLTYTFQEDGLEVRATRKIAAGETLLITYGALSNSHLLVNYGFCIADNVEPDGSWNDVVPLDPLGRVILQVGPKSYTYGKFVQALEYVGVSSMHNDDSEHPNGPPSFDAFLEEGSEDDFEDEDVDLYGEGNPDTDYSLDNDGDDLQDEKQSCQLLQARLQEILSKYGGDRDESTLSDRMKYAKILIESEKATLEFFLAATRKVAKNLDELPAAGTLDSSLVAISTDTADDTGPLLTQLIEVYFRIRHS